MSKKPHWSKSSGTNPLARQTDSIPSDNLFGNQWHLQNTGQSGGIAGVDLNVTGVWDDYTGAGVTVAVYDDSVQFTHHDLDDNYDASQHITLGGGVHSPAPSGTSDNHGTAVAGIIAAENNGTGTVGVAYDATLVGVDALAINTFPLFGQAMSAQQNFDVVNHSWGFITPFAANEQDGTWSTYFFAGIDSAVENGRGGLGTNIVTSAGNDRQDDRDVNDSNFTSTHHTIAVAAMSHDNSVSYYSTPGAAVLVSATTNGPAGSGVWTTDRLGGDGYNSSDYTGSFGGTSAAAPMVSGVVALMLEANSDLGWRDVQQILSYSAKHAGSAVGTGPSGHEKHTWSFNGADTWNGGGLHFSNDYGFGRVDALAAVRLAETWTLQSTSANEATATGSWAGSVAVPDNNASGVSFSFAVGTSLRIEAIDLDLTGSHSYVGDLVVTLTSPDGTVSTLLDAAGAASPFPATGWTFTSHAFRGELSSGTWTVTITDRFAGDTGAFTNASFTAYGSADTTNDLYVYTEEFGIYGTDAGRQTLSDTDGGEDTINAAAVTTGSTINLNAGAVSMVAGATFAVTAGSVVENVYGGDGDDTITGNAAANELIGGRGDDSLRGGSGDDRLDGGVGADVLRGDNGNDYLNAGAGNDALAGHAGDDELFGCAGNDFLYGNGDNDMLWGGTGHDVLIGESGDDILRGESGNDYLNGGDGNDALAGHDGLDILLGGAGNDFLYGNGDSDMLWGGTGNDVLKGESGNDILRGEFGDDHLEGGEGNDALAGHSGADTLIGGAGNDFLYGNEDNDALFGGTGNDVLRGDSGVDQLRGEDGNDYVNGGSGDDVVDGGAGLDMLFGGDGADTFIFVDGAGSDEIYDWEDGLDMLDFSGVTAVSVFDDLIFDVISDTQTDVSFDDGSGTVTLSVTSANAFSLDQNDFIV